LPKIAENFDHNIDPWTHTIAIQITADENAISVKRFKSPTWLVAVKAFDRYKNLKMASHFKS
jgi:hypothetical protein